MSSQSTVVDFYAPLVSSDSTISVYDQFILLFLIAFLYILISYYIGNLLYNKDKMKFHQKEMISAYKDIIKNADNPTYIQNKTKEFLFHSKELIIAELLVLTLIPLYLLFYYILLPYVFGLINNPINFKGYFVFFVIGAGILFSIIRYFITKKSHST